MPLFFSDTPDLSDDLAALADRPDDQAGRLVNEVLRGGTIAYGDYQGDLEQALNWKQPCINSKGGRYQKWLHFGSETGLDALEFCCLAEKARTGLDDIEFDGDPAEYCRLLFREYRDEMDLALRYAKQEKVSAEPTAGKLVVSKPKPRAGKPAADSTLRLIESLAPGTDRKVACLLMWKAGLRIAEALALKWSDLAVEPGYLYIVRGKGGKPRLIPLAPELEKELLALLKARKSNGGATPDDKVVTIKREAVQKWLGRHDASAHSLRHAAGYAWGRVLDIDEVALLLGHSSSKTTERYRHANAEDIGRKLGWTQTEGV